MRLSPEYQKYLREKHGPKPSAIMEDPEVVMLKAKNRAQEELIRKMSESCSVEAAAPTSVQMLIPGSAKDRLDLALALLQGISEEEIDSPAMLTSLRTARRALQQAARRA